MGVELYEVVGGGDQAPLGPHGGPVSSSEPADPAVVLDLLEPWLDAMSPNIQGYNAQAVVSEHQIIIAAEISTRSPDFGHLEPMVRRPSAGLSTLA